MTTITFRRPTTVPLKRKGQCVPTSTDFCVTQQFDDPDYYWSNVPNPPNPLPTHRATDIGNFRCGFPIVAMAAGIARRVQDNATSLGAPNNALGVVIDHGGGITTEYWHLASWSIGPGDVPVNAGQEIGKLGNTGLGQVCHTHVEAKRNGVRIDAEPLMFGGSITIGTEEDMKIPTGEPIAQAVVGGGNRLRTDPMTTEGSRVLDRDYFVQVYSLNVKGQAYTLGGQTSDAYAWVGVFGQTWFVAKPLLAQLALTDAGSALAPKADCVALENQLARARTAVNGADQALDAAKAALA